jgi:hypothetical protein
MSNTAPFLGEKSQIKHTPATTQGVATAWEIVPLHRLPVVVKTPFMVAVGAFLSGAEFRWSTVGVTMLLGGLLWAVLYPFNEATDLYYEENREISRLTWVIFALLLTLICGIGWQVRPSVGVMLFGMVLSQLLYCFPHPRVRLKRHWWGSVLLSGTVNPVLRLWCGAVWGVSSSSALIYTAFLAIHLGAALRARLLLRERDNRLGYSPIPTWAKPLGVFSTAVGLLSALILLLRHELPQIFGIFWFVATLFACYAWSGRAKSMQELRRGWLLFAALSVVALIYLYFNH